MEIRSPFRSWVPVWNRDSGLPLAPSVFAPNQTPLFNASASRSNFKMSTRDKLHVLSVNGVIVDRLGDFKFVEPDFKATQILAYQKSRSDDPQIPTNYPEGQTRQKFSGGLFWRIVGYH
jgi:hypothetical protein